MNDPNALGTMQLSALIIKSLEEYPSSPADKIAALRTAAFAIEQANLAQQSSVMIANYLNNSRK